jgi:rubrerythrin
MKSFVSTFIFAILCLSSALAFTARPAIIPRTSSVAQVASSTTSLNIFGKRKTEAEKAAQAEKDALYWQGEWVCKDCGYIYQRVSQCSI